MNISYQKFIAEPPKHITEEITTLHQQIFGGPGHWLEKLNSQEHVLIYAALVDDQVAGYKIGYGLDDQTFYSWLGGVHPDFRKLGIASDLMRRQHADLKDLGYEIVRTKTMNKWRGMLLLNIQTGFDVLKTEADQRGQLKIVLEKKLLS
ncbi:GNAT family N-acetyltransferase [Planococcus sp. CP5-4]|uniref:GNAT family N-acetyltransferase n=1 Tax=unclassified Planococcus (in: firmicutes) TaxID=2662419 RepID=UPI001C241838|nr:MULTISPECIES: GNAT family N-acetyltransferase [unclassified Planococcus (in: firmicutes)]MBU9674437.1 GNAT family N-acetyltransferase [Planococcus sp. CP5-4_YE]MBV0909727.1 GNAT family N-acetyltransferase [Planococcus sp. CP5-4_UN]MBW6064724.1 GNAT family N-acetyltransferase [Planococcus sp. CP5-4]